MADRNISNLEYDLMITIANLLQARDPLVTYAKVADKAGDGETAPLLRSLRDYNEDVAPEPESRLMKPLS